MPNTRKNHFIPCFYSKQWVGSDGRLCEFTRPHKHVVPRRTYPTGTGYRIDIYTETALPIQHQTYLEDVFLKKVDQQASDALVWILKAALNDMPLELKQGWVRFLMSMLQRTPTKIDELSDKWKQELAKDNPSFQERYASMRRPQDPESFQDYMRLYPEQLARGRVNVLQRAMDLPNVGGHILNMRWAVISLNDGQSAFLTSDRPIVMTNGLAHDDAHLALATSPSQLFVAANKSETLRKISSYTAGSLSRQHNEFVAKQAECLVFGKTDKALRFVERHLRHKKESNGAGERP